MKYRCVVGVLCVYIRTLQCECMCVCASIEYVGCLHIQIIFYICMYACENVRCEVQVHGFEHVQIGLWVCLLAYLYVCVCYNMWMHTALCIRV